MDCKAGQVDEASPAPRPVITWTLMLSAAIVVLLLLDWTGSGVLRPIWIFSAPVLLGLVGAALP